MFRQNNGKYDPAPNQLHTQSLFANQQPSACEVFPNLDNKAIVITTGGTIAGSANSAISGTYQAATLSGAELIKQSIPDIGKLRLDIEVCEFMRVDSSDITIQQLLNLAKRVNSFLDEDSVKGIVITHGTDTLEETSYFLNLVVKSRKPVVLVGSMRPSTSLSPDGPMNLYNALSIINNPGAVGRGVMVLMNDTVFGGRDVTKTNTTEVNAFVAPNSGPIGKAHAGQIRFNTHVDRLHTIQTKFDISAVEELPEVEVIYECLGSNGKQLRRAIHDPLPPAGIVIAGTGDGNIPFKDKELLEVARQKGIHIVRSSRTGSGEVTKDGVDMLDTKIGLIPADNLNPQKARILLMLSLAHMQQKKLKKEGDGALQITNEYVTGKVERYFGRY